MIGWWERRRALRLRNDEDRVLAAIRMLRPSQAGVYPIYRLARISPGRTYVALARLEKAGRLVAVWEPQSGVAEFRPRRRLYRIPGSHLVEAGR